MFQRQCQNIKVKKHEFEFDVTVLFNPITQLRLSELCS